MPERPRYPRRAGEPTNPTFEEEVAAELEASDREEWADLQRDPPIAEVIPIDEHRRKRDP